jgi:hypothetical protein
MKLTDSGVAQRRYVEILFPQRPKWPFAAGFGEDASGVEPYRWLPWDS